MENTITPQMSQDTQSSSTNQTTSPPLLKVARITPHSDTPTKSEYIAKLISGLTMVLVMISIPVTVFLLGQQQDIRQQAQEELVPLLQNQASSSSTLIP